MHLTLGQGNSVQQSVRTRCRRIWVTWQSNMSLFAIKTANNKARKIAPVTSMKIQSHQNRLFLSSCSSCSASRPPFIFTAWSKHLHFIFITISLLLCLSAVWRCICIVLGVINERVVRIVRIQFLATNTQTHNAYLANMKNNHPVKPAVIIKSPSLI